jgi:hypothetical protein
MAGINIRSPYYIKYTNTVGYSVKISIRVFTGVTPPSGYDYEIIKNFTTAIPYATVDISELARDFLDIEFSGDYLSQIVKVYVVYAVTDAPNGGGSSVTGGATTFYAFDGYGNFTEGVNPTLSETILIDNKAIYRPEDENIRIPIYDKVGTTTDVVFLNNGVSVRSESFTGSTDTASAIKYIAVSGDISVDNYRQRVLADGGTYEGSSCLDAIDNQIDINLVDEVRVHRDGTYDKVVIKTMQCDKYPDRKVTFVNKLGALQDVYFFAKEVESITSTSEQYKANVIDLSVPSYDVNKHQYRQYNKQGRESIQLNTGYVSEDYNEIITQMMMSEQVWLTKTTDEQSNVLPVIPKTSNVSFRTSLNDKLVAYTIDFDYAFDKIQNIR